MNDLYTKTVLSIIAAALLALVVQNAIHPSQAQSSQPQKVQICGTQHCADLVLVSGAWGLGVVPLSVVPLSK
jgi:hypothetical protein